MPITPCVKQIPPSRRKALIAAAGVGFTAVLLVVVSVLFAQSDQTARAIDTARQAQRAEEVLTATTAARSSIAVVLVLSSSDARLEGGEDAVQVGLSDLLEVLTELDDRVDRLRAAGSPMASTDFAGAGATMTSMREVAGDESLQPFVEEEILPLLNEVETEAAGARDTALALLAAEEGTAGTMARAASVAVGLLVPGLALLSYRGIQRRQQLQRELELRLEHEEERSRIKDEMIANLSHELRTPLTGIYGMALTLSEQGFSDPRFCGELTDIIVGEAADLSRMVDDLLVAAKVEAGDVAIVPAALDPIDAVAEVSRPFLRSRKFPISMEPGGLRADPLRFKQIVRNLLSNAIKHGGDHVALVGRPFGDRYRIRIVDDGPGVSEDLRGRLFDRFVHDGAAPLTAGSVGLGLAIAKELVERMEGELSYERYDGFTAFNVDFPLVDSELLVSSEETPAYSGNSHHSSA